MELLESNSQRLLEDFEQTRNTTMNLVRTLEQDDYVVQTAPYTSPPKWHIGHTSWIYEAIMSKIDQKYEFYSKEFSKYLNSYYEQFGTPHDKTKRGAVSRPNTAEIFKYTEMVNQNVRELLTSKILDEESTRLIITGIHHECQHQELLVYDLQHMLASKYKPMQQNKMPQIHHTYAQKSIRVDGGLYDVGYESDGFCYDIELPKHKVYLEDYKIDAYPVTCQQYAEFINDGGYRKYKYWLADGWKKISDNGWSAPMYWEESDGQWFVHDFVGFHPINANTPVCNVSYYEASAYCKWAGKRLPTEQEWEKAAVYDSEKKRKYAYPWGMQMPDQSKANLLESYLWGPADVGAYPLGASPSGCEQMIGNIWEWTSSEFVGYPRFKSAFDEYNDKWFTNQKVLRGGSFATPSMSIRTSYRNFFRLDERWMFAGFRCAQDA